MYYRQLNGELFNIARSYLLLNCVNMQGEVLSEAFAQSTPLLPNTSLQLASVCFHERLNAHNVATVVLSDDRDIVIDTVKAALHNVYLLCKERHITHIAMPQLHLPLSEDVLKEIIFQTFHDLPVDFVVVDKQKHRQTAYRKSIFVKAF